MELDGPSYTKSLAAESQLGGKHARGQSIQLPALKESQFKHHTTSNELKALDLAEESLASPKLDHLRLRITCVSEGSLATPILDHLYLQATWS